MSLVLLFHYLLLNMFRMLVRPSSGACDLLWIYFMCCIAVVRYVLALRCGSAGVVWYPYAGCGTSASACIRISHTQSQAPEDECTSIRNMLSKKIKQVTSVGLSLFNNCILYLCMINDNTLWSIEPILER